MIVKLFLDDKKLKEKVTHSLTHSLTEPTHPLTYSLTHSLIYQHIPACWIPTFLHSFQVLKGV